MKKISFLFMLFFAVVSSFAQNASLDTTFNPIDIGFGNGDGANSDVNCSAIQSDGKILIAGSFTSFNGISANYITRLNIDGTIDTSFDTETGADNTINSLAIQSDGKIIIAGNFTYFDGTTSSRIARLNTDGSLDTTFTVGTGANAIIYSLILQSDDKILIGGNFTTYNGVSRSRVARLNADGTLDTAFVVGTAANSSVYSLAVQSDGKIIVGGNFTTFNGTSRNRIVRLLDAGGVDTTFNVGSGSNGIVYSIDVQSNGRVLIGGAFTSYNATSINRIARLNDNGSLDSEFSVGTGADATVFAVNLKSDGSILIGGSFTDYNGTSRNSIARLSSDGSLDTDFVVESGADGQVKSITLQADSKIIIGGQFTNYNGNSKKHVARLNANGNLDVDFVVGTGANNEVYAMAVQTD